jgi:pyridoxamine 5'-phosphate oxidase family protein
MAVFTEAETAYLDSQMLCRLATVGADGRPHVVPVGYRYNPGAGDHRHRRARVRQA